MNCKETKQLLLTYLDNEASAKERDAIHTHLSGCASCREELEALASTQRGLRQGLNLIAAGASPSPHAWAAIKGRLETQKRSRIPLLDLAKSRIRDGMERLGSRPVWQKALVSALTVALITGLWLVIPAMASRKGVDFETVLERMRLAYSQVQSYRYQHAGEQVQYPEVVEVDEGPLDEPLYQPREDVMRLEVEGAYLSPDRSWWKHRTVVLGPDGEPVFELVFEEIQVGNKRYWREPGEAWVVDEGEFPRRFGEHSDFWLQLECLVDVKQLSDEKADGVNCLRYRGKVDMDAFVDKKPWPWLEDDEEANKSIEMSREYQRHTDTTIELLIGEDDYLIREIREDLQNPYSCVAQVEEGPPGTEPKMTVTGVTEFYDYNEPVEIEPPL